MTNDYTEKNSTLYVGELPDDTITIEERNAYGYDSDELLPLDREKALEFFDKDLLAVYLLYPDGTEGQALERADIENHIGIFGVETVEWENFQAKNRTACAEEKEPVRDVKLSAEQKYIVEIYQLKKTSNYHFLNYEYLSSKGVTPVKDDYDFVYSFDVFDLGFSQDDLENKNEILESVYEKFNVDRPADFRGHSLSVSDVVVIRNKDDISVHFVDSIGFKQLDNSSWNKEQPAPKPVIVPKQSHRRGR